VTQNIFAISIVRQFGRPLLVLALLIGWLHGCATSEEATQKSKGYYQEGLASLDHDQQKAFVSFQKAVKLDPNNKEARYGLGHILAMQGKFPQAEEEFRVATALDENYSAVAGSYCGIPARADQSFVSNSGSGSIPSRPGAGS